MWSKFSFVCLTVSVGKSVVVYFTNRPSVSRLLDESLLQIGTECAINRGSFTLLAKVYGLEVFSSFVSHLRAAHLVAPPASAASRALCTVFCAISRSLLQKMAAANDLNVLTGVGLPQTSWPRPRGRWWVSDSGPIDVSGFSQLSLLPTFTLGEARGMKPGDLSICC